MTLNDLPTSQALGVTYEAQDDCLRLTTPTKVLTSESVRQRGPPFLYESTIMWPKHPNKDEVIDEEAELRRKVHTRQTAVEECKEESKKPFFDIERFSSFAKAKRVTANVMTFIENTRKRRDTDEVAPESRADTLRRAEITLLKLAQAVSLQAEVEALRKGKPVSRNSGLRKLSPFITPTHHTAAKSSSDSPIPIIGDSIIKHIDPKKISRKKTIKRTFPGKTAEQIKSEVESMEVEVLPSHIIVHAGTNDLSVQPPHNCVKNIENLALCIKKKFTDSRIAISSITVRNDLDLSKQISTANEELQKMCSKNGFDFIKNNNIDATCLNGGLLHLNSKGSAFLATNFIKFLRGNIPAASEYRQRKRGEDFQGRRTYQNHSLEGLLRLLLLAQRTEY